MKKNKELMKRIRKFLQGPDHLNNFHEEDISDDELWDKTKDSFLVASINFDIAFQKLFKEIKIVLNKNYKNIV